MTNRGSNQNQAVQDKHRKISKKSLAILLVICDSFFFSLMALFVRLSGGLPTVQKAFFRNAVAGAVSLALLARTPEKFKIKKGSLPGLIARAAFGGSGLVCNFWAIDHIGLADANMMNKMSPFFAIVFSIFVLGEVPTRFDIVTVIAAFIGAAFVVKPTAGIASLPALVGLLGGMGAGIAYTFVRKLGRQGERRLVIVAFFSCSTSLACLPFMAASFHPMTFAQTACLVGAGIVATFAQFAVTSAYQLAPAKEISVFDYAQVLFASIWGILFFHELPDVWSFIGYVIIIGTAFIKWRRAVKEAV